MRHPVHFENRSEGGTCPPYGSSTSGWLSRLRFKLLLTLPRLIKATALHSFKFQLQTVRKHLDP